MEAAKLKVLLDRYYSGDILPDEYQTLLSCLKDNVELAPDLEAEQKMLLAIESCQPYEPEDHENRLSAAIDCRSRRRHSLLKTVYSISAAAVVLIFILTGIYFHEKKSIDEAEQIAEVSCTQPTVDIHETLENEEPIGVRQISSVMQGNPTSYPYITDDELEKSAQIVDEALMEVLASIHLAQNEVIEVIDNIEITQTSDYNIL